MKYIIILSFLLLSSCNQKQVIHADSDVIIESFFNIYKNQSPRSALNEIFATNTYFETMHSQSIDEVKDRLIYYTDSIGEYCEYEIVSRRAIGHSLMHYSCVVKYENPLGLCSLSINLKTSGGCSISNFPQTLRMS